MAQTTPDQAYLAKQASLKNFLPFLESMVKTLKDDPDPSQDKQLFKIRSIKKIIEGSKSVTIDQLYLLEKIIHTLYEQKTKKDPKELAENVVKTQDPTLSSTTTTTAAKMIPTHEVQFRPAILKRRTESPSNSQRSLPSTSAGKRYGDQDTRHDSRYSSGREGGQGAYRRHSPHLSNDRRNDPKSASNRLGAIVPTTKPDLNLVITRRTESSDSLIRSVAIPSATKRYEDRGRDRDQTRSWSREGRSHSRSRERSYSSDRVSPNSSRYSAGSSSSSGKVTSTVTKPAALGREILSYDEIESPDSPEQSEPSSSDKPIIIPTERTCSEYLLKKEEDISDDEDISKTTYEKKVLVSKPSTVVLAPTTDKVKFKVLTPSPKITQAEPPSPPDFCDENTITIAQTTIKKVQLEPPKPSSEKVPDQLFTRRPRPETATPVLKTCETLKVLNGGPASNLVPVVLESAGPQLELSEVTGHLAPTPIKQQQTQAAEPINILMSPPLSSDDINNLMRETGSKEKIVAPPPLEQPRRVDPRLSSGQKEDTERLALKYRPHKRLSSESPGQMSPPVMNVAHKPTSTASPFVHKDPRVLAKPLYPPPLIDTSLPPPSVPKPQASNITYKQYKQQKAAEEEKAARMMAAQATTAFKNVNDEKSERLKYELSKKNKDAQVPKPILKTVTPQAKPETPAASTAKKPTLPAETKKSQFDTLYRTKNFAQAPPLAATPVTMQKFKIPKLNKQGSVVDNKHLEEMEEEVHDDGPEPEMEPVAAPVVEEEPVKPVTKTKSRSIRIKSSSEEDEEKEEAKEPEVKKGPVTRKKPGPKAKTKVEDAPVVVVMKRTSLRRKSVAVKPISDEDEPEIEEPVREAEKSPVSEPKPMEDSKPAPKLESEPVEATPVASAVTPAPVFSMEEMFKLMQSYAAATKVAATQGKIETKDILNILKPLLTEDKFEAVQKIVGEKDKEEAVSVAATTSSEEPSTSKTTEESVVADLQPPAPATTKRIRKSRGKTELEKLNEDLEDFFKNSSSLNLSGRRACTLKEVESSATPTLVSPSRSSTKSMSRESSVETLPPPVNKPGPLSSKRNLRQALMDQSSKVVVNKQLKVVLEKVTVPMGAEAEKKPAKKPRKRKSAWSSGVIRKARKATGPVVGADIESSEDEADDKDDDDGDELPSIKNNDPECHIRKLKTVMKKCKLCEHDTGTMVNHYVRQHPKSEVYVSRVTPRTATSIMEQPLKIFGKMVTDDTGVKRIQGPCRICGCDGEKLKTDWVLHLASHTGEYRYRCSNCTLRCRYPNAWKTDIHDESCAESDIVESLVLSFKANHLYAYMCSKCNYVQGKREHVEKHIRSQHGDEKDVDKCEIVEFSVINYPKKKKPKGEKTTEDEEEMPALSSEPNTPIKECLKAVKSPIDEMKFALKLQVPPPEEPLGEPKIAVVNEKYTDSDRLGEDKTKINLVQVRDQNEENEYNPLEDDAMWEDVESDGDGFAVDNGSDMEIDEKPSQIVESKPKLGVSTSPLSKSPLKTVTNVKKPAIKHDEETIRNHAKRINTCGFADIDDTFYFICRIDCLTFFTDRSSFQQHIERNHATATWNGYCYVCECQVLEDEESPIDKQIRHMLTVHVKNRDLKDTVAGSPKASGIRPKISFRRLSGDVLSSLVQTRVEKSPGDSLVVHSLEPIAAPAPVAVVAARDPDNINLTPWIKNSAPATKRKEYCQNMLLPKSLYCLFKCMEETCCFTTQNPYKFMSHLKNHENASTRKGPAALVSRTYLKCAYCDDMTNVRSCPDELTTHIQKWHGTSIFQCPYCFYRSTAAYNIVLHRDLHHADRQLSVFVCEGPQTLLSNELDQILENRSKHVLPLVCSDCRYKFYVVDSFMAHLNSHSGPFTVCQVCDLSCFKKDIAKHLLTHRIGLYECVYCLYGTNNINNIRMHMGSIHPSKLLYVCVRLYKSNDKNVSQNAIESTVLAHIGIKVDMRNFEKCPYTEDELNHKTPDLVSNSDLSMMKRLSTIRNANNTSIKITSVSSLPENLLNGRRNSETFDTNESVPGILSWSELEQNCASSSSFDEPSDSVAQYFPEKAPAKIAPITSGNETPLSSLQALQARLNQQNAVMVNQPTAPSKQNEMNVFIQPVATTTSVATSKIPAKPMVIVSKTKPLAYVAKGPVKVMKVDPPANTPPPPVFQMPVIASVTTLKKDPEPEKVVPVVESHATDDQFTMPQISSVESLHDSKQPPLNWSQDTSQPIMITNVQSLSREQLLPEPEQKEKTPPPVVSESSTPPPSIFPTISSVCSLNANSTAPLILSSIVVTKPAEPVPDVTTIEPIIEEPTASVSPPAPAEPLLPKVVGVESLSTPSVSVSVVEKLQLATAEQEDIDSIANAIVSDSGLDSEHLYKCGFKNCNTISKDVQMFQLHQLRHNQATSKQGDWRCAHCSERSKNIVALKNHIKLHGRKRFFCLFCDYKHSLSHFVTSHMSDVHRVTHTRQYPLNPGKLDQNKDIFLMGPQNMTLHMLKQFCINFKKIYEHRRREEINKEKTHYAPNESDLLPTQPIFAQTLFCTDCGYSSKVRTNMLRHLVQHSKDSNAVSKIDPVNPVPCLEVGEKHFDKMWNFSASSVEAVGGSLSALIASTSPVKGGENGGPGGNLPKFVPEQKRFVCGARNCAYLTIDEPMFSSHITTLHEQEQNYQCPHCQQVVSPGSLAINKILFHLKLHDNKLYKCTKCDHLHYHKNLMEKHMSDAHPKQSVAMQVIRDSSVATTPNTAAPVASTSNTSLSSPAASVQWKCEICKLKTSTRPEIEAHLKTVHSYSYRYRCGLCKYTSSQKKSFPQHFNKRHPDKSVAVVTRYNKCQEADELDTTPLWSRNTSKTKHIRGILFDEEDSLEMPAKSSTVEEDPIAVDDVDEPYDDKDEPADDKKDKSYRPSRSKAVRKRRSTKRNSVTAFDEPEISAPPYKKTTMSDDPLALSATESAVLDPNVCKPFSCGYKDCKFSDDSVQLIKVHYGAVHNSNQFSIIRNDSTRTFADQPTPHMLPVSRPTHIDDDDDESIDEYLRYCCGHCESNYMIVDEVKQHWRVTHQQQPPPESVFEFRVAKLVICSHCNRSGTIEEIKKHSLQTHLLQDFACVDSMNPIKCGECEFEASFNRSDVIQHFSNVHNKLHWTSNGRAYDHINQAFIDKLIDGGDCFSVTYRCQLCRLESFDSETVIQHFLRKHMIRFNCLYCDQQFKYLTLLRLHQRDQHDIDPVLQLYRRPNIQTAIDCLYQNVLMIFSNGLTITAGEVRNTDHRLLRLTKIVEEFIESNFYNLTDEEPYSFYNQPPELIDLSQITVRESRKSQPVSFIDYFMNTTKLPRLLLRKVGDDGALL